MLKEVSFAEFKEHFPEIEKEPNIHYFLTGEKSGVTYNTITEVVMPYNIDEESDMFQIIYWFRQLKDPKGNLRQSSSSLKEAEESLINTQKTLQMQQFWSLFRTIVYIGGIITLAVVLIMIRYGYIKL